MSEREEELDPLLIDVLEGRLRDDDPAVRARLDASPELRSLLAKLRSAQSALAGSGSVLRADIAAVAAAKPTAEEDSIVAGFRAHAAAQRRPRIAMRSAWLAAAAVLAIVAALWWTSRREDDDDYLGGPNAMFVRNADEPFGSARWRAVGRATTYEINAFLVRDGKPAPAPIAGARLRATSWSLPTDHMPPANESEIEWQIRAFDVTGVELARDAWRQRR